MYSRQVTQAAPKKSKKLGDVHNDKISRHAKVDGGGGGRKALPLDEDLQAISGY